MGRRYRRKSAANSILRDTAYIGSRLSWWGALMLGLISFIAFYYFVPGWLEHKLADRSSSNIYPTLEAILGRRIHLFQWLGIACGLIGCFFGARNYLVLQQASYQEQSIVRLIARWLGKHLE